MMSSFKSTALSECRLLPTSDGTLRLSATGSGDLTISWPSVDLVDPCRDESLKPQAMAVKSLTSGRGEILQNCQVSIGQYSETPKGLKARTLPL